MDFKIVADCKGCRQGLVFETTLRPGEFSIQKSDGCYWYTIAECPKGDGATVRDAESRSDFDGTSSWIWWCQVWLSARLGNRDAQAPGYQAGDIPGTKVPIHGIQLLLKYVWYCVLMLICF
jgi:hypothetical protein